MTDGITILCSIYKTLETAYCDNPLKSELLLRDHLVNLAGDVKNLGGVGTFFCFTFAED